MEQISPLTTARMVLRPLTEADVDHLVLLDSDPAVMKYLTGGITTPRDVIVNQVLPSFLAHNARIDGFGFWTAIERATGEFLGWFHLRPSLDEASEAELGYRLMQRAWGKGLATEGATALVEKGFRELGVSKIVAMTMSVNERSRRVMEKVGLVFEKEFVYPGAPFPGWRVEDCLEVKYSLTRTRWQKLYA